MAANSFMKIDNQKIKKRKPVVRDNWQTLETDYFSSRAATADMRESKAKTMPYPTHASAFSGLSAFIAKKGAGMAIPPNRGLVVLYISVSFQLLGMCCFRATVARLLNQVKYSILRGRSQAQTKKSAFLLFICSKSYGFLD